MSATTEIETIEVEQIYCETCQTYSEGICTHYDEGREAAATEDDPFDEAV